jgi:beta-glucosidase
MRRTICGIIFLFIFFSVEGLAQQGEIILLKNHGGILPLDNKGISSLALIGGKHHEVAEYFGDSIFIYSSKGLTMINDVKPLDTSMVYIGQGVNGFSAKYYNNTRADGTPAKFTTDKYIDFTWGNEIPWPEIDSTTFSAKWDATLIPPHGPVKVKLIHNDGCRLYLDGKIIIDAWEIGPVRMDSGWLNIEKGQSYNLQIDYFTDGGPSKIKFGFEYLKEFMLLDAVEKARRADMAVVFIEQPWLIDAQGNMEPSYQIPVQTELVRAVYEANPNTIVVMQTRTAVDIESWAFDIPAILMAWEYQSGTGKAIAEALLGQMNPYGKLPFRWTMNENQNYDTRFAKGYGMNYTTIGIGKLMMKREPDNTGWLATVETRNVGSRAGTETLQLFVRFIEDELAELHGLKASEEVTLFPGQKKTIGIHIPYGAFEISNEEGKPYIIPGKYEIMVGKSEEDIKLRKTIELKELHIDQYYQDE